MLQDTDREVATFLNRKFGGLIASIETVAKEDLDLVRFTFRVFRFGDSILSLEVSTLSHLQSSSYHTKPIICPLNPPTIDGCGKGSWRSGRGPQAILEGNHDNPESGTHQAPSH